ncbi:hypothetical protein [Photorhabdus bodei]|uniref:Uncharacterized protein n=1 Tax=Photorhabdus bodei TaxID=2029681 RepID=A0AAW6BQP6_9GAMM|nr:hypothetical protein [Photorhabdus bodei]MDB6374980.1 hypothetical protein [Photorhabdus bodei]
MTLSAGRGMCRSSPELNRPRGYPERQAPPLLKSGFIFRPVGNGVSGFGDMMSVFGVVFMWHPASQVKGGLCHILAIHAPTPKKQ